MMWVFFSSSDELQIFIILKPFGNDLVDITNDNVLMSLGNTKLTIVGLKDVIDSTTTVSSKVK